MHLCIHEYTHNGTTPSGDPSGKPPFSFRKPSGTAAFWKVSFIVILFYLKVKGKVSLLPLKTRESREKVKKINKFVKKPFRGPFRETMLFLPETFRDCGVLDVQKHLTFSRKSASK